VQDVSFDRFARHLASRLDVEVPEPLSPSINLYDELGLDSLQAFQMLIIIENMAESMMPPMELPALHTLGDSFDYYKQLRTLVLAESNPG
jgi:acyl carrier protein